MGLTLHDTYGGYNPKADGHCGWRSVSRIVYNTEHHFDTVKECMRSILLHNKDFYAAFIDIERQLISLLKTRGSVTSEFWFDNIDCPQLVADVYKRPVVLFASGGDTTFLPFTKIDEIVMDLPPIILLLRGAHFNAIIAKKEATTRVKWPRIFPAYQSLVNECGFSQKWLEMYTLRCRE